MNNVMKDLETWGKKAGCAIRSIGSVMFDPYGNSTGEEFYCNVSRESCEEVGLIVDPGTEEWWNEPKQARAQESLLVDQVPVRDAAADFCKWFIRQRGVYVWSQGANFDEPIMCAVLAACGMRQPWKFYNARDTRTAYDMAQFNPFAVRRAGTHHNALADAKHQARCVQMAYAKVHGRKS